MTQIASEVFTMQLARAAGKKANKFLRSRGLQQSDRDDVIAAAMLWCWENRNNYSLTTTLETWFMNAIRDAYKNFQRNEVPTSDNSLESMGGTDTTYEEVAAESSARTLFNALTPVSKEIASLMMEGYTYREILKRGYSQQSVNETRQRIKQLRRLIPDEYRSKKLIQTAAASMSDDADMSADFSISDRQLAAALDFPPKHDAKDCPVCWRCMWFEGYMPTGKLSIRLQIADQEVRAAVEATEARKVEIAQQVRDGL